MNGKGQMPSLTKIVEAVNLKKTYMFGKAPVNALRGVNLRVENGYFLAILRPFGSGKSSDTKSSYEKSPELSGRF